MRSPTRAITVVAWVVVTRVVYVITSPFFLSSNIYLCFREKYILDIEGGDQTKLIHRTASHPPARPPSWWSAEISDATPPTHSSQWQLMHACPRFCLLFQKYDITETNIAGIGTPLDKAIREASAGKCGCDHAMNDAVPSAAGFEDVGKGSDRRVQSSASEPQVRCRREEGGHLCISSRS